METAHPEISVPLSQSLRSVAAGMTILLSLASVILIHRAATSANHWAFDIRLLWPFCGMAALYAGINLKRHPSIKRPLVILLVIAVTSGVLVFMLDRFNLVVDYDVWLRRSMPEAWATGGAASNSN